jgi:hypothetical protein
MEAMAAMDITTLRVPAGLAEPEAMAVSSVMVGMAVMGEPGLRQVIVYLFPAGLAVQGGTEVLPAAMAVLAEREALHP